MPEELNSGIGEYTTSFFFEQEKRPKASEAARNKYL